MGSVPPLRRFNALEACVRCDLLRDPRVMQGPFRAFVPLQRCSPQPRPVPPVREPARRTEQPLLGFCCPTTRSRSAGIADRGSTRDPTAACGVWLPPARPAADVLPAREAPERPWASPFRAFPPCAPRLLSEPLPSWRSRSPRRTGWCTRERVRLQGLALGTGPFGHRPLRDGRRCPRGVSPSRAFPPPVPASALVARPPLLPPARADVTARRGSRVFRSGWIGVVRLRTAGSPGIRHLLTVAALRSPGPGVGTWLRLAPGARLAPPSRHAEPPDHRCSLWPGP